MRVFILLCIVGAACAKYTYGAGQSGGKSGRPLAGSDQVGELQNLPFNGIVKEFYTFTAPEERIDPALFQRLINKVKKSVRVIFIKNPENKAYEDAVLNLAAQAAQQNTHIYVLNKQHDLEELANKFNAIRNDVNAKPQVHFVKYRTPEDAANAQQAIQSEYDALGGRSQHINGGIAPAINFASLSPQNTASTPSAGNDAPEPKYLPASILRSFRIVRRS